MTPDPHRQRPASHAVPHPQRRLLHRARPVARRLVRSRYRVGFHGTDRVQSRGPVILAANHIGVIDGPLLAAFSPRPVHTLTKQEMFRGRTGRFLTSAGQVPLDRFHHGAAYLARVTGAPVVPAIFLGTREQGGGPDAVPARGSEIDLVFGPPTHVDPAPWPRCQGMVRDVSTLLRGRLIETLTEARTISVRDLPGPLPPGQHEDDPDTGLVERGA